MIDKNLSKKRWAFWSWDEVLFLWWDSLHCIAVLWVNLLIMISTVALFALTREHIQTHTHPVHIHTELIIPIIHTHTHKTHNRTEQWTVLYTNRDTNRQIGAFMRWESRLSLRWHWLIGFDFHILLGIYLWIECAKKKSNNLLECSR